MKHTMRSLLGLLSRMYDGPVEDEQPIYTSIFALGKRFSSTELKEECRKNLKILEEKGWLEMAHDPFTTTEKNCGKIFEFIKDPGDYRDITFTKDPVKQKMLDRIFSELPRRGEIYSPEVRKEILRGNINDKLLSRPKINKLSLENAGGGDWPLIMSALKEWESQGLLKIIKDPQTIVDDQEICIETLKFID